MIKESDLKIRQTNIVKKQRQVEFRLYLDQDADEIAQLTRERSDLKHALAEHEHREEDLKSEIKKLLRIKEEKTLKIKQSEQQSVQSEHQFDLAQREYRQLTQEHIQLKKEAIARKEQLASLKVRFQGQGE